MKPFDIDDISSITLTSIGPIPPPYGGTTVLFADYISRISELVENHHTVNTSNSRNGWSKVFYEIAIVYQVIWSVFRSDVVALHASINRFIIFGALLRIVSSMTRTRVIVRCFGGGHDIQLKNMSTFKKKLAKIAFKNDLILLETKYLCNWAENYFPSSSVDWHPNCRSALEISSDTQRNVDKFLYVGKVSALKGVDTLIRMKQLWPDDPFSVDVIGSADDTVDIGLLDKTLGLTYVGPVPPDEAVHRLRTCQALLLPSRYPGEGYPGVILEAFTQGIPVIASRWRAIPELVQDDYNGYLVPVDDEYELRKTIIKFLDDREKIELMSRNALKTAENFSSVEWHGIRWQHWIRKVLNNNV